MSDPSTDLPADRPVVRYLPADEIWAINDGILQRPR